VCVCVCVCVCGCVCVCVVLIKSVNGTYIVKVKEHSYVGIDIGIVCVHVNYVREARLGGERMLDTWE